jgi:PadR family transcriptional regulator PadR
VGFRENFKKGSNELLILSLLSKEDMYGYQISHTISEKSNNIYTVAEGSLYPILYRLSQAGYISERIELVRRRTRVYYHLEESGRLYYEQCLKEYYELSKSVSNIIGEGK